MERQPPATFTILWQRREGSGVQSVPLSPSLSDSSLPGGYPIMPLSKALMSPSEYISELLTDSDRITLWEALLDGSLTEGCRRPNAKGGKNFLETEGLVLIQNPGKLLPSCVYCNFCLLLGIAWDSSSYHDRRRRPTFLRCHSAPDLCTEALNHCSFTKGFHISPATLRRCPCPSFKEHLETIWGLIKWRYKCQA